MIVSVHCPICGHHLAGHSCENSEGLKIMAYCPMCDKEYLFEEHQNTQKNKDYNKNIRYRRADRLYRDDK